MAGAMAIMTKPLCFAVLFLQFFALRQQCVETRSHAGSAVAAVLASAVTLKRSRKQVPVLQSTSR